MILSTSQTDPCTLPILLMDCRPQSDNDPAKELQINGVYCIPGARQQKPGTQPDREKLQLLIKDLGRPNGIAFSPDEKFLYTAESGRKVWLRYRVQPDGSVSDGDVFLDPSSDKAPGGPDGIRWMRTEMSMVPARGASGLFRRQASI